jgi:hypothetical protein
MAGNVTSVNFSGRFKKLNGIAALTATRADIIRSLLTEGYPSRRAAVRVVGRGRNKNCSISYAKVERSRNVMRHVVALPGGEAT